MHLLSYKKEVRVFNYWGVYLDAQKPLPLMLLHTEEDKVIRDAHSSTKSWNSGCYSAWQGNSQALILLQAFPPVLFLDPCMK